MSEERTVAVRRLFAFAVDWFVVVVLWGGGICGAVVIANGGKPPQLGSPWAGQAITFLTITVPFTLYLALCESSPMRASLGKRALGLVVSQETGGRLFEVSKKDPIDQIYARISEELRNQYNLGYTSDQKNLSGYHKIHLATKQKDLIVQARDGYYSPEE